MRKPLAENEWRHLSWIDQLISPMSVIILLSLSSKFVLFLPALWNGFGSFKCVSFYSWHDVKCSQYRALKSKLLEGKVLHPGPGVCSPGSYSAYNLLSTCFLQAGWFLQNQVPTVFTIPTGPESYGERASSTLQTVVSLRTHSLRRFCSRMILVRQFPVDSFLQYPEERISSSSGELISVSYHDTIPGIPLSSSRHISRKFHWCSTTVTVLLCCE